MVDDLEPRLASASSSRSGIPETSKLRLGAVYYRDGCGDFLSNHAALSWWKSGLALPCRHDSADPARDSCAIPENGSEVGL